MCAVVSWHSPKKIKALRAIEDPQDKQVGESINVYKARFELRQNFENPLRIVLRGQAFGNS
jgi:hypothetical protein